VAMLQFALFLCALTASPPSSTFRFVFTALRDIDGKRRDGLQLSEVTLYDNTGAQLTIDTASNPGGVSPNKRQKASSAIDGLKSTKWFDASIIPLGSSELRLTLPAGAHTVQLQHWRCKCLTADRDAPAPWCTGGQMHLGAPCTLVHRAKMHLHRGAQRSEAPVCTKLQDAGESRLKLPFLDIIRVIS